MDFLSLFMGGGAKGWVEGALVIGLFYAAVANPDRITCIIKFRVSMICLCLALVTPVILNLLIGQQKPGAMRVGGGGGDGLELAMYAYALPPFLSVLAVYFGIDSVIPRGGCSKT